MAKYLNIIKIEYVWWVIDIRKRGIIVISMDSLRADHLNCYGYQAKTSPNIDKISRESILFRNAFSAGSYTKPSLNAIFTSTYPFNFEGFGSIILKETIALLLRKHGFVTAIFSTNPLLSPIFGYNKGVNHFFFLPSEQKNFKRRQIINNIVNKLISKNKKITSPLIFLISTFRWISLPYLECERTLNLVLNFLRNLNKNKKFFIWVHLMDTHTPFLRQKNYFLNFHERILNAKLQAKVFDNNFSFTRKDLYQLISLYDAKIQYADKKIGEFYDKLDELRLLDDLYLIFTSDHGEEFLEHGALGHLGIEGKTHMYNELIRVPLIIFGMDSDVKVVNENVSLIDLGPTILSLFDVSYNENVKKIDGKPIFTNNGHPTIARTIFSESDAINITSGFRKTIDFSVKKVIAIIKNQWKYIYNEYDKKEQLFNIEKDPLERKNLITTEMEITKDLKKELFFHLLKEERNWKLAQKIIKFRKKTAY